MKRGQLFLVQKGNSADAKKQRVFAIVSREYLVSSRYSSVICAPVYNRFDGLSTQVPVGVAEGLKHESAIHCDELLSLQKSLLTHFVGSLGEKKLRELEFALRVALDVSCDE